MKESNKYKKMGTASMRLKTSKRPHTYGDKPMSVINNVDREA